MATLHPEIAKNPRVLNGQMLKDQDFHHFPSRVFAKADRIWPPS
jgi:hypothetical protein